jgi:hypothetical protein
MRAAHDRVLSDLRLAQDKKGESIFEANVAAEFFTPFAIGDFVWYKKSDLKKSKLDLLSLGPYQVMKIHSPYSYGISDLNTKKEMLTTLSCLLLIQSWPKRSPGGRGE